MLFNGGPFHPEHFLLLKASPKRSDVNSLLPYSERKLLGEVHLDMATLPVIVPWEIISLFKRTLFLAVFLMPNENIDSPPQ